MIAISVIVPVYNVEKYLKTCIESLLNQTLKEIEFIFVNDGSPDNSQMILESYQKYDARIVLFEQSNQGVSAARNKGLSAAKGQFVGFVDADDFIELNHFQTLYEKAVKDNVDLVCSNVMKEQDGVIIASKVPFKEEVVFDNSFVTTEIIPFMIKNSSLNSCCTKLFKTAILQENSITFPVGMKLGEDGIFTMKCFFYSNSVSFLNYYGYHYREVAGSATRSSLSKDYFKTALEAYHFNYLEMLPLPMDAEQLEKLKTVQLIDNVMSYINMYLKPSNETSFLARYRYVSRMISNPIVQSGIKRYADELHRGKSKYQKFLLYCIQNKSTALLVVANQYSVVRNKK